MDKNKQSNKSAKHYDHPLNHRIRELVNAQNIADLAQRLEVTQDAVNQWRAGYTRPDVDKLGRIAEYFSVSTDFLLGVRKEPTPDLAIQGVIDYTGLSENAIKILAKYKEKGTNFDPNNVGDKDAQWIISNLITHPNFQKAMLGICMAQYFNGMSDYTEKLIEIDHSSSDEEQRFTEEALESLAYRGWEVASPSDLAIGEEYKAVKMLNQITFEMCAVKCDAVFLREYIESINKEVSTNAPQR